MHSLWVRGGWDVLCVSVVGVDPAGPSLARGSHVDVDLSVVQPSIE